MIFVREFIVKNKTKLHSTSYSVIQNELNQNSLNRTNQSTIIKEAINSYLDKGVTDKQDIYSKVVDELGVPRPTVRRVARDLRTELLQKIQILQSDMPKTTPEEDE